LATILATLRFHQAENLQDSGKMLNATANTSETFQERS
jgi:hypothetical protein